MSILIVVPLAIYQHFSEEKATLCTIVFGISVGVLTKMSGYVPEYAIGKAIGSMILGGLYFGFLGRLDKEKWVYWALLIIGGVLLVVATG